MRRFDVQSSPLASSRALISMYLKSFENFVHDGYGPFWVLIVHKLRTNTSIQWVISSFGLCPWLRLRSLPFRKGLKLWLLGCDFGLIEPSEQPRRYTVERVVRGSEQSWPTLSRSDSSKVRMADVLLWRNSETFKDRARIRAFGNSCSDL